MASWFPALIIVLAIISPFAHSHNHCTSPPDSGPCLALFTKYYYDTSSKECKTFVYGGCGGNDNKFDTERECLRECKHD